MSRKTLAAAFAFTVAIGVISGCEDARTFVNKGLSEKIFGENIGEEDIQVVTVWSDNAHEKSIRDAQVEEFNNTIGKREGIKIEYKVYGADYEDAINAALIANEGPDLFRPSSNSFAQFVSAGYAVPISDLEGSDSLLSLYKDDDLLVGDQIFNDKIYTLPYSLQSYKMIVNKDLFDKAGIKVVPKTWNEVREDAKLITEVSNGDAYGYFLALKSGWTLDHYIYSAASASLGHFGYDAVSGTYRYSDGIHIINNILGMIEDGSVFPGYENMDADTARALFAEGKVGITMAASFDVAVYNEQFPIKCNWVVCDPPSIENSGYEYKEMVTAVDLLAVSKKALEAEDTSKVSRVLEWFYDDENLAKMYEQGMYIPYRKHAVDIAPDSKVEGWKEFATFKDDQFIIRMADPKGIISYDGPSARETLAKLFAGEYSEDAEDVLKNLDERLNAGLVLLDDDVINEYVASSGYRVERK